MDVVLQVATCGIRWHQRPAVAVLCEHVPHGWTHDDRIPWHSVCVRVGSCECLCHTTTTLRRALRELVDVELQNVWDGNPSRYLATGNKCFCMLLQSKKIIFNFMLYEACQSNHIKIRPTLSHTPTRYNLCHAEYRPLISALLFCILKANRN